MRPAAAGSAVARKFLPVFHTQYKTESQNETITSYEPRGKSGRPAREFTQGGLLSASVLALRTLQRYVLLRSEAERERADGVNHAPAGPHFPAAGRQQEEKCRRRERLILKC
jgi:hypothetical protein